MGKSLIISNYGAAATSTVNTTQYWNVVGTTDPTTSEVTHRIPFRTPGTLSKLTINVFLGNSTSGGSTTVRLRKNGANANQVITIPAGTPGIYTDTTNTDTIAAGDQLCIQTVPPATGTITVGNITMLFEATDNNITDSRLFLGGPLTHNAWTGYYSVLSGILNNSVGTTTNQRIIPRVAGEFKYFATYSQAGGRGWVHRLFKNNVDDFINRMGHNLDVTGLVENTTDVISVNATDDVLHEHAYFNTGTSRTINWYGLSFITGTKHSLYVCGRATGGGRPSGSTDYLNLSGHAIPSLTEQNFHTKCLSDFTFSKLQVRVLSNTINSGNSTITFRKNGVDTALAVTIPAGNTGLYTDLTDTVTVTPDDIVGYRFTRSGTSGSLAPTFIAMLAEDISSGATTAMSNVSTKALANRFITKV